jgi:hypothetical protein
MGQLASSIFSAWEFLVLPSLTPALEANWIAFDTVSL